MGKFLIYGLSDPRTHEIRYVGKSSSGLKRPREHKFPSVLRDSPNTHRSRWIKLLLSIGLTYDIVIIEELPGPDGLYAAEQFHIKRLRSEGFRLTNHTDGGPGLSGWKMPQSQKDKLSSDRKGKPFPEEVREKLRGPRGPQRKEWVTTRIKARVCSVFNKTDIEEINRAIILYNEGNTLDFCAETVGLTRRQLTNRFKFLGVKIRKRGPKG